MASFVVENVQRIGEKAQPHKTTTLADVAHRAGVTKAAASFAFSGKRKISSETRERVFAAARELEYHPNPHAQRLSAGVANNVVGLFSLTLDHMAWRSMSLMHQLLASNDYEAPLYTYGHSLEAPPNFEPLLASLCRQLPQGLICNSFRLSKSASGLLAEYQHKGGHLVCLDSPLDLECDQVLFDRDTNTYLAARHLLEAGHREIGLCTFGARDFSNARTQGFLRAHREFGVDINEAWLFESGHYEEGGAQLAQHFLALKKRPTGICIVNDMQSSTFVHQLLLSGLEVPRDVSVVSLDGLPASFYGMVKLTTVTQPWEDLAKQAVECLLERMTAAPESDVRRFTFAGEVIERDSVRRL